MSRHTFIRKTPGVRILQWVYILTFASILGTVYLLHRTPRPFLDIIRTPTFFRGIEPYIGVPYITSMTIYHFTFAYFLLIIAIDAISLFFYSNLFLKRLSLYTSFIGFFLIGFVLLYFGYSFLLVGSLNPEISRSALAFLLLSLFFFVLDLATFFVDEVGIYHPHKH